MNWFTGRFYGFGALRANLHTATTISWKLKLILHYCGLWQHQRQTCGNCNDAVASEGDWCKSCLAQVQEKEGARLAVEVIYIIPIAAQQRNRKRCRVMDAMMGLEVRNEAYPT